MREFEVYALLSSIPGSYKQGGVTVFNNIDLVLHKRGV